MSRKIAVFTISILTILTVVVGMGCGAGVKFTDDGLAQAVAQHLGVADGSLRPRSVAAITELDASNHGITSLDGIAALKSLQILNLDGNQLADLNALVAANLPNLNQVSIVGNPLPADLESVVYSQVANLRNKGVSIDWLPTFVARLGAHSRLTDLAQASDGSFVALSEGRLHRLDLLGKSTESYPCPGYPGLANIVEADGIALCNASPLRVEGPWVYYFGVAGGFDFKFSLDQPSGVYQMSPVPNGDFLLTGRPYEPAGSATITRLDGNYALIWSRAYGEAGGGLSAISCPDGYILLCERGAIKFDSEGNLVKALDLTPSIDKVVSPRIGQTDAGYVVLGATPGNQSGRALVTFAPDLTVDRVVPIPVPADSAVVRDFAATSDGGFVVVAFSWAFPGESADGLLLKMDATGEVLWSRSFRDYALDLVIEAADGGLVIAAHARDWMTLLIRTDASGLVSDE